MRLILGSQSPRRKDILNSFALPFVQISSAFDEDQVIFRGDPSSYVLELAQKKGLALADRFPSDPILTADTVVYFDKKIYNKPKDEKEAFSMLRTLSGQAHFVYTGVSIRKGVNEFSGFETTKIFFNSLTDEQIRLYHQNGVFLDKAGGYALQGAGGILVSKMEGCYYNVIGLPLNTTKNLLAKVGIDLWQYLKINE